MGKKRVIKTAVLSLLAGLLIAMPAFAGGLCKDKYPNLSLGGGANHDEAPTDYPVRCQTIKLGAESSNNDIKPATGTSSDVFYTIFAKSIGDCAQAGTFVSNPDACNVKDANNLVTVIITTIIFAVGMIAVVMIILGGISYATSQGDPSKVKKAKDTILYGIIGLVVALLAYAIVNFVLSSMA